MPIVTDERPVGEAVAFRDARWKTRWLIVGLGFLALWRSVGFLDPALFSDLPPWLLLILTGLVPQVFLLLFPILTRNPSRLRSFRTPSFVRFLTELGIAIPVVVATVVVLAVVNYLMGRLSPGTSLTPDAMKSMAAAPEPLLVYLTLLFAFTFVPIAEEVFFRGFLYNAFRARMPWIVAFVVPSLLFGFGHTFGAMHSVVAFVLGMLLTLLYEWRKTLISPILVHAGINLIGSLAVLGLMLIHAETPVLGVAGDPNETPYVIRHVAPGSAADDAGLQAGDAIHEIDGEPMRDHFHLVETLGRYQPGDTVTVTVERGDSLIDFDVVLQRRRRP